MMQKLSIYNNSGGKKNFPYNPDAFYVKWRIFKEADDSLPILMVNSKPSSTKKLLNIGAHRKKQLHTHY